MWHYFPVRFAARKCAQSVLTISRLHVVGPLLVCPPHSVAMKSGIIEWYPKAPRRIRPTVAAVNSPKARCGRSAKMSPHWVGSSPRRRGSAAGGARECEKRAKLLGISARQMKRLRRKMSKGGVAGRVHGNRDEPARTRRDRTD